MLPCYTISKSAGAVHQFLDNLSLTSCNELSYFGFYNLIFIHHFVEFSKMTFPLSVYLLVVVAVVMVLR